MYYFHLKNTQISQKKIRNTLSSAGKNIFWHFLAYAARKSFSLLLEPVKEMVVCIPRRGGWTPPATLTNRGGGSKPPPPLNQHQMNSHEPPPPTYPIRELFKVHFINDLLPQSLTENNSLKCFSGPCILRIFPKEQKNAGLWSAWLVPKNVYYGWKIRGGERK